MKNNNPSVGEPTEGEFERSKYYGNKQRNKD